MREAFEKLGKLEDVFLPKSRSDNTPRGFGFVLFENTAEAEEAARRAEARAA